MITIWKTVLRPTDVQDVELPKGAQIICAREQLDDICIWYRCDPEAPKELRRFAIHGTGHRCRHGGSDRFGGSRL